MKSEAVMQFKRKKKKATPLPPLPSFSWIFLPKADIIESLINTRIMGISIKIRLFEIYNFVANVQPLKE